MSFFSILSTIEKDINAGIEFAAPIIGTFFPTLGPILTEIGDVVSTIEGVIDVATGGQVAPNTVGPKPPAIDLSALVQNIAYAQAVRQHAETSA